MNFKFFYKQTLRFYMPIYWPLWLIIGILKLLILLPYRWQLKLGTCLGIILLKYNKRLSHIATINIELCFPKLNQAEQEKLLRDCFVSLGISIFEMGMAWWASDRRLKPLAHIHGIEHLEQTIKEGKGILMVGIHFTTLEIAGRLFGFVHDYSVVYRKHKIPFINYLLYKWRNPHYKQMIERQNTHSLLRNLRKGEIIWYTPDIDGGHYNYLFSPFFNIPAATITACSRLPQLTQANTILASYYRRDDGTGYDLYLSPKIENFPSGHLEKDVDHINYLIEEAVRKKPEQYIWQYMRFKTRPPGEQRFYKHSTPDFV